MLNKKNLYPFSVFFVSLFIVICSLNYFYKKFIPDLSIGNDYQVSSSQLYGYKKKSIQLVLKEVFASKSKSYKVKKFETIQPFITINGSTTFFNFTLNTTEYIEEKILEQKLNNVYVGALDKVVNDLQNNFYKFDYDMLKKEYMKLRTMHIKEAHDALTGSQFFKNYPPDKCNSSIKFCLAQYSQYYNFINKGLQEKDQKIVAYLNEGSDVKKTFVSIFKEFNLNQSLYESNFLDYKKIINNYGTPDLHELNFFKKKLEELVNSRVYSDYIKVESFENYRACGAYADECLQKVSTFLNDVMDRHKLEAKNVFSVSYIKKKDKKKSDFIKELPISVGLTALLSYIFFTPFNRFFMRKKK